MTELRNRQFLTQEFKDGERPSGKDFEELFESVLNKTDDGLTVDTEKNLLLTRGVRLGDSASTSAGTLRFNGGAVQFNNGTTWVNVASGASGAFQPVGASTAVAYSAGNVGINTGATAPTYRLQVELGTTGTAPDRVRFGSAVCGNGSGANGGFAYFSHQDHSSNTNYALRQSPEGNVHINAPNGQIFSVRQNGNLVRLGVTTTGHVVVGRETDLVVGGTTITAALQVAGSAFIDGNLNITGDAFKATAGAWQASDVRVKENIRNLELGLQHLVQVRPVRFRYNGKAGTPSGYEGVGIVGQEMEKIFPDMVRHVTIADSAEPDSRDLLMYNDAALTYVLVNAVKELAGKVQKLEAALALAHNDAPVPASDTQ